MNQILDKKKLKHNKTLSMAFFGDFLNFPTFQFPPMCTLINYKDKRCSVT